MNPKLVRQAALGLTIFFDIVMLVFWALAKHWGFFWCFVTITIAVLVWELINNFVLYGKTLSTEALEDIERGGKRRALTYLAISSMVLAILSLAFHLGWVL